MDTLTSGDTGAKVDLTIFNGKRVRAANGGPIYFLANGKKCAVTQAVFDKLFVAGAVIWEGFPIDFVPDGYPIIDPGSLIRGTAVPDAYIWTGGLKLPIPAALFTPFGFDPAKVQTLPDANLNQIPTGWTIG